MFIVDIIWKIHQDYEDSFSYDSFSLAISETERFLSGRIDKPISINIYESDFKYSDRKHIASLRVFR
jgi:hypothetical protein